MTQLSRRRLLALLGGVAFGGSAFGESAAGSQSTRWSETFGAWLVGENEVPPVETGAFGFAGFAVAADRASIDYWLVVVDIERVEESHVHKGPPDLNGNVVSYLFGPAERPVSGTGLLASGVLTDDDMIWPLTDVPDMVEQMREENVYVNVHTTAHPAGEIRGQIRSLPG